MSELNLLEMEEAAYKAEQIKGFAFHNLTQSIIVLTSEVRRLNHELVDPRYMYSTGRVPRQGITCRNAEIDALRKEVEQLKKQLEAK